MENNQKNKGEDQSRKQGDNKKPDKDKNKENQDVVHRDNKINNSDPLDAREHSRHFNETHNREGDIDPSTIPGAAPLDKDKGKE